MDFPFPYCLQDQAHASTQVHQVSPEALQQHKRLHDALADLRGQVHQLGRQNKAAPQLERLSAEDLVVDVRLRARLREAAAQSIKKLQVGPINCASLCGTPCTGCERRCRISEWMSG